MVYSELLETGEIGRKPGSPLDAPITFQGLDVVEDRA
jgi:hypothetical protein